MAGNGQHDTGQQAMHEEGYDTPDALEELDGDD
jgi:hypothetical protein